MPRPITVDLIPKKKSKGAQFLKDIRQIVTNLYVALSFLPALTFLVLYGVMFFYSLQLEKDLEEVKNEVASIEGSVDLEKKQEVKEFAGRLDAISFLLDNNIKTLGVFKVIESITHKEVVFNRFSFLVKEGSVSMTARTRNYRTFAEQMIALEQNRNVTNIAVTNVKLGIDGVTFNITFNIIREVYIP